VHFSQWVWLLVSASKWHNFSGSVYSPVHFSKAHYTQADKHITALCVKFSEVLRPVSLCDNSCSHDLDWVDHLWHEAVVYRYRCVYGVYAQCFMLSLLCWAHSLST